jgi:hypothetical protein
LVALPGRQNWPAGWVKGLVWPISETSALGASSTRPQPSAFPSCCVSKAGIRGPAELSSTMVPEWPVVRSVTGMCTPSCAGVTYWWSVMVSPACIKPRL